MSALKRDYRAHIRFCHDTGTTFNDPWGYVNGCLRCKAGQCARIEYNGPSGVIYICCNNIQNRQCDLNHGIATCGAMHTILHEAVHLGGSILNNSACGGHMDTYDATSKRGQPFWDYVDCICTGRLGGEDA